jgi:hypothetical protein
MKHYGFEYKSKPLLSRRAFAKRMFFFAMLSVCIMMFSLFIGMLGYHTFEGFSWTDSFLNAAMLMGGMGPMGELHTESGKIFAGCYALYCGLVLIISVGLLAAPVFHRFLHKFHLESADDQN